MADTRQATAATIIVARKIVDSIEAGCKNNRPAMLEEDAKVKELVELYAEDWEARYLLLSGAFNMVIFAFALLLTHRFKNLTTAFEASARRWRQHAHR